MPKIEDALAEVMEIGAAGIDTDEYRNFMRPLNIILNNFNNHVRLTKGS